MQPPKVGAPIEKSGGMLPRKFKKKSLKWRKREDKGADTEDLRGRHTDIPI